MTPPFDLAAIRARLAGLAPRIVDADVPRAAVVVPLCTRAGQPAVLFTKRTDTVSTHKGQVSFPGGRMDPEDRGDIVTTALRELDEELGIRADAVDVLGVFHEVISITNVRVTPVVAFVGERADPSSMTPSPAEIDAVFALTLDELTGKREVRPLRTGVPGPWYTAGPHPVWGLTAFILDEVMREVLDLDVPPLALPP